MKLTNQTQTGLFQWRSYIGVLAVIWTVIVGASLEWNIHQTKQKTLEFAYIQAKITMEKDLQYRMWNANHGGVYIPVTEETPPNPYLAHIPERDITTPSGKLLTLMNPAYMTRRVNEIAKKERFFFGHLTSLKPLRPENAPDLWEKEALQAFERGETEVRFIGKIGGQDYFRLMRPFRTEEPCLKCHSAQGYKKGDIRGGISVSNSMAALYAIEWKSMRRLGETHLLVWLIGLAGIGLMAYRITGSEAVRKQAEIALRRMAAIVQSSDDAIIAKTLEGTILNWNEGAARIYGYAASEIIGRNISILLPPDHADEMSRFLERIRGGEHIDHFETKRMKKDGQLVDVSLTISPVKDTTGKILGVSTIARDITEHKRVGEALRKSEERYRSLFENSMDANFSISIDGKILDVNSSTLNLFGYRSDEIVGLNCWETFVGPEDGLEFREEVEKNGFVRDYEIKLRKKDGTEMECLLTSSVVWADDGSIAGYQGVIRDITEHKKIEEALRESNEKFRDLYDHAPVGYFEYDTEGRITNINQTHLEMLGYMAEEIIGQSVWKFTAEGETAREQVMAKLSGALPPGKELERTYLKKDGTTIPVLIEDRLVLDTKNRIRGIRSTIQDITERKEIEKELQKAKEVAEAANHAKSEFLANMSHEIRTPMNAIVGLSHLALKTDLTAKQRDYMDKIVSSSHGLLGLLNDILDLSKIEAGRLEIERTNFHLDEVLNNIGVMVSHKAGEKGLEIHFRTPLDVPQELVGDPLRLGQVLLNLVANAVKFTETGEVVVSTELMAREGERVRLRFSVKDTGIGISKEEQARLFQPFTQADGSMTRKYGGTGLGLAISKQLVERMGGEISVESIVGVGSTFAFTLPFGCRPWILEVIPPESMPTVAQASQTVTEAAQGIGGARVLVVEDNEINQQVAQEILESFGLKVEIAANGKEAVDVLQKRGDHFEAVLMDLQMPEMDGHEATRVIRSTLNNPSLPIIAMTAHALESERENCLKSGMNDYVSKPVDPDRLLAVLTRWIKPRPGPGPEMPSGAAPEDQLGQLPGIDIESALKRMMGNRKFFIKLLCNFGKNYGGIVGQIREALAREDMASARRTVHSLKGVSGNLSATEVYGAVQDLEASLQKGNHVQIGSAIDHLEETLRPVLALATRFSQGDSTPVKPSVPGGQRAADAVKLATLLAKFDHLLKENSMNAGVEFALLKENLPGDGYHAPLERIEACLGRLNFKEARRHLASVGEALGVEVPQ